MKGPVGPRQCVTLYGCYDECHERSSLYIMLMHATSLTGVRIIVSTKHIHKRFATGIVKEARPVGALAAAGSLPLTAGLPASRWVRRSPPHALQRLARAHFIVSSKVSSASMHMHVRCHACCCSCMAVEHVRARSRDVPAAPLAWTARGASSRASLALGSGHACALPGWQSCEWSWNQHAF